MRKGGGEGAGASDVVNGRREGDSRGGRKSSEEVALKVMDFDLVHILLFKGVSDKQNNFQTNFSNA